MALYLLWFWFFWLMVLTGYTMVIFRRRPVRRPLDIVEWPGVSIIIAHKDHSELLIPSMQFFDKQDYPLFEILVVDDHSTGEDLRRLKASADQFDHVRILTSDGSGKKAALNTGIAAATHDHLLFTDADCRPLTNQWIKKMVASGRRQGIVLGYSPYEKKTSWLNTFIRFETVLTAIQYFSWALIDKPYMAVGRNILYPRKIFLSENVLNKHPHIPYGDDDITIQYAGKNTAVFICYDAQAHILTQSKATWKSWWKQKHRHVSAARFYQLSKWWQPGLYGIALVLHWSFFFLLFFILPWWRFIPVFIIGLLIRWIYYAGWTSELGEKDTVRWYPLLELQYACYLAAIGIFTMIRRKRTWN
jgi:glycosyltransferase involved in cell wall biosynthesis